MVYSDETLWNKMQDWFSGGPVAAPSFSGQGQLPIRFDNNEEDGATFFESFLKLNPGGENEDDEFMIETSFLRPFVKDESSWGYKIDTDIVKTSQANFKTPEYFQLDQSHLQGNPIDEGQLPVETNLTTYEFEVNTFEPLPLLTPLETDCPWFDPNGPCLNPGPVAGPFQVNLEDGSTLTYHWYRFIDQPAILAANLPSQERQALQQKIELIHTHWKNTDSYLPNLTNAALAELDGKLIVQPPEGLEIGYVPIVTRQEKSEESTTTIEVGEASQDITEFVLYPNPSKAEVYSSQPLDSTEIFSLNGRRILSSKSADKIDLSILSQGLYIIKSHLQNGQKETRKILKN